MPEVEMVNHFSTKKKLLLGILMTFLLASILLALAEGGVRVRAWFKYGSARHFESLYYFDNDLKLKYPIANYTTRTIRINSRGFRGPELDDHKDPNSVRLAFLGGSTTFCAEVSGNDQVWPHLVWKRIQVDFPKTKFDYINGGVPGYTLSSSLKNLQHRIAPLKPDVIVIYHATNDLSGETRDIAKKMGLYKEFHTKPSWLERQSLLWHLVRKNLQIIQVQQEVGRGVDRLRTLPDGFGAGFRRELETLIGEAQKLAKLVVVVTWTQQIRKDQPAEQKLKAAASALYYMPFMTPESLLEAYQLYNQGIREVAHRTGALLVEGENSIPGDDTHFNDTVHFKDAGSHAMAERINRVLLKSDAFRDLIEAKK